VQVKARLTEINFQGSDRDKVSITYVAGETNRVDHVNDALTNLRRVEFVYDDANARVMVKKVENNALVATWTYQLDGNFPTNNNPTNWPGYTNYRLTKVTSPTDQQSLTTPVETRYEYYTDGPDARKGLIKKIIEPNGDYHKYEYYANGRVFRVIASVDLNGTPTNDADDVTTSQTFSYNLFRNLTEFTDERGNVETYIHQNNGLLTKQIHPDRSRLEFSWGAVNSPEEHLMTSSTDEHGAKETFTFYASGQANGHFGDLKQSIGKDGLVTNYEYWTSPDPNYTYISRLKKVVVDPDTATGSKITTQYEYDNVGNLTALIDAEGHRTEYQYYTSADGQAKNGLRKSETLPKGLTGGEAVSWQTLSNSFIVAGDTLTVQLLSTTTVGKFVIADAIRIDRLDEDGTLTRIVDDAATDSPQFRAASSKILAQSGLAYSGDYMYLPHTSSEQPVATWIFTDLIPGTYRISGTWPYGGANVTANYRLYDALADGTPNAAATGNQLLAPSSFHNYQTVYDYDAAGNLTTATVEGLPPAVTTYDTFGNVKTQEDATGVKTTNTYDIIGRLTKTSVNNSQSSDPLGVATTTFTYDASGRIKSTTDALGRVVTNDYDANGRLVKQTFADGTFTEHEYDEVGNCIAITDELGQTTRFVYDSRNRVIQTISADGTSTQTRYNGTGQVVESIDELGHSTTFKYDRMGRLFQTNQLLIDPDGSPEGLVRSANQYDHLGNLVKSTDPNGNVTINQFDKLGRVVETRTLDKDSSTGFANPSVTPVTLSTTAYDANGQAVRRVEYDVTNPNLAAGVPTKYVNPAINFEDIELKKFEGTNQTPTLDTSGSPHAENGGRALYMDGNSRKAAEINYKVTPNTVLELDFKAMADQGELFGIGIVNNLNTALLKGYRFGGTNPTLPSAGNWSNIAHESISSDGTKHYRIEIGLLTAGLYNHLVFVNSDLGAYQNSINGEGKSLFSNVRIYDDAGATTSVASLAESYPSLVHAVELQFDAFGRPVQITNADGTTTSTIYDAAGRVRYTVDELGRTSELQYDKFGRLEKTIAADPDGIGPQASPYARYERDRAGNIVRQWEFFGADATSVELADEFIYDNRNRLVTTLRKDHTRVDSQFDAVGRQVAAIDALGNSTYTVYDERGRALEQRLADPDGPGSQFAPVTKHEYDAAGNVTSTTDALGNKTSFEYDSLNRLRQESHDDTIILDNSALNDDIEFAFAIGGPGALRQQIPYAGTHGPDLTWLASVNPPQATWTFSNLVAGTYRVSISRPSLDAANGKLIEIPAKGISKTDVQVSAAPAFKTVHGDREVTWHTFATVSVALGENLDVVLRRATDGILLADAVRLDRVVSTERTYDGNGNLTSVIDTRNNETKYFYDELNRLEQTQSADPDGSATALRSLITDRAYDGYGNLKSETHGFKDAAPATTFTPVRTDTFEYDQRNRLIEQTLDVGDGTHENVVTQYDYDAAGNKVLITDPLGFKTAYRYDALGRVIDEYSDYGNVDGSITTITPSNPLSYSFLDGGRGVASSYSLQNGALTISGDTGKSISINYTVKFNTVLVFTVESNWAAELHGIGIDTDNNFNGAPGQLYLLGGVNLPAWDSREFLRDDRPDGPVTFHIPIGQYLSPNDKAVGLPVSRLFFLNADARLGLAAEDRGYTTFSNIRLYESDEQRTVTTYDARGNVESVRTASDPRNIITAYEYDRLGRETQKILDAGDPMQRSYATFYDAAGNVVAERSPAPNSTGTGGTGIASPFVETTHEYDRLHRLTKTTLPDPDGPQSPLPSPQTLFSYDPAGNLIATTNGEGETTRTAYDAQGNAISESDGNGDVTRYRYNSEGSLTKVIDAEQNVTRYTYDALNRETTETITGMFNGVLTTLPARTNTYDLRGNLLQTTDRDGRVRVFAYNRLDRLTQEEWKNTAGGLVVHTLGWQYDDLNRIIWQFDGVANATAADDTIDTFVYDGLGRLVEQRDYDPNISGGGTSLPQVRQTYGYGFENVFGVFYNQVTRNDYLHSGTADTGVATTRWLYDRLGQLQYLDDTDSLTGTSSPYVSYKPAFFGYDAAGNLASIGGGLVASSFSYDDANRLTSLTHDVDGQFNIEHEYSYDNASRATSFNTIGSGAATRGFVYDDAGQLKSKTGSASETYDYDDNGNRTFVGSQPIITGFDNRLKDDGTYTYEYDNEGNLKKRTLNSNTAVTTEYAWDHRNRLLSVTEKNGTTITKQINYTYDADGRRVQRLFDSNGAIAGGVSSEYFVYDGSDLSMRFGNAQDLTHRYLYGPLVDQVLVDETFKAGQNGQRVSDEVLWQLADQQGTIRDIVDASGTLRKHVDYDSFGRITGESYFAKNGSVVTSQHAEAVDALFGYTGQERDKEAGLYNYNARWYDPAMGRFISEDPSGFDADDPNLYRYVGNDPINHADPTGLVLQKPTTNLTGFGGGSFNPYANSLAYGGTPLISNPPPVNYAGVGSATLSTFGNVFNSAANTLFPGLTATTTTNRSGVGATGASISSLPPVQYVPPRPVGTSGAKGVGVDSDGYVRRIAGNNIAASEPGQLPIRLQQALNDPLRYQVRSHQGLGYNIVDLHSGSVNFIDNVEALPIATRQLQLRSEAQGNARAAQMLTLAQEAAVSLSPIHETVRDFRVLTEGYDYVEPNRVVTSEDRKAALIFMFTPGGNSRQVRTANDLLDFADEFRHLRIRPNLPQHQGREFRIDQLELLEFDPNAPAHVRGWLANERRRITRGGTPSEPAVPPGYELGHGRTTPAREGYDYTNSQLQGIDLNQLQERVRRQQGRP
jgi:RHS repeat-associated protein